jgi:hypothetical protein
MFGNYPSLLFDLSQIAQRERAERLNRSMMIAEARRGREPRFGLFCSVRRSFGAGIIGLGNWIRGERVEIAADLDDCAAIGSVKMAR